MKLYWSSRSPFVRKVMVVAHEAGLAAKIERIPVVVAMTNLPTPEVMKHNPLNKIPTLLTDDGQVLFESVVVCEYLDSLHSGEKMFPAAPADRWRALRWHALGSGMLEALLLWRSESRRPEGKQLPTVLDAFAEKIRSSLDLLEREAGLLSREKFNIGHVGVGCALAYADFRFPELEWRSGRPRLADLYASIAARPSMRATEFVDA